MSLADELKQIFWKACEDNERKEKARKQEAMALLPAHLEYVKMELTTMAREGVHRKSFNYDKDHPLQPVVNELIEEIKKLGFWVSSPLVSKLYDNVVFSVEIPL